LRGKTVVITGASSGIGAEAACQFAGLGATVAVVGRSKEKTEAVARSAGGQAYLADFTKLDDVRRLAAELLAGYEQIDILANNAGAIFMARTISTDGHELTFQVNYLAPYLLTTLLLPTDVGRDSPFFHNLMNSWFGRMVVAGPSRGAEPLLNLATAADPAALNGKYFNRLKPQTPGNAQARDPEVASQLWDRTAKLI
jgi:NAD(P)-dependent dehydrogenase (short-subunit alcohol dehydrogenase family)